MAGHEPAADQEQRNEFLWHVHSYINDNIRFADTKAHLVIGWATALAGALAASGFYHAMVWPWPALGRLSGLVVLVFSVVFGVCVIRPRLRTSQTEGFIYWLSILGHRNRDDYLRAVDSIGANEAGRHVAVHNYDLSEICKSKYWWVNLSVFAALLGGILSGLLFLYT